MYSLDSTGAGWGPVAGSCQYSNEPSGSIKAGEFLNQLSGYELLKGSAPCSWFCFMLFNRKQYKFLSTKNS
jgi:hypothetical protein